MWKWLLWKSHEIISILFINNTLFWFRLNILLNESSGLTFWIRFGISNYNPYSLFRSTYQCHQNKDNRNSILQNWESIVFSFGRSTFNHFDPYQSLLPIVNEQESSSSPLFLPYLTVSDITNHAFLLFDSFYNQSFIDWWIIDYQTLIVWFFAFIDSISFVDKEYGYRFW